MSGSIPQQDPDDTRRGDLVDVPPSRLQRNAIGNQPPRQQERNVGLAHRHVEGHRRPMYEGEQHEVPDLHDLQVEHDDEKERHGQQGRLRCEQHRALGEPVTRDPADRRHEEHGDTLREGDNTQPERGTRQLVGEPRSRNHGHLPRGEREERAAPQPPVLSVTERRERSRAASCGGPLFIERLVPGLGPTPHRACNARYTFSAVTGRSPYAHAHGVSDGVRYGGGGPASWTARQCP